MRNVLEALTANDYGSQARFVAVAKRNKPMAWQHVELLKAACALAPAFSLEQSAAAILLMISGAAECFGFKAVDCRAHRSMWC